MAKLDTKKIIWGIAGIIVCILFCTIIKAPASLESAAIAVGSDGKTAMGIIGTILLAIIWWAGCVQPDWVVSLIVQCVWVIMGFTSVSGAFHSYTNATIWLFIGVFCITAAVNKSGLIKRLALLLMKGFSPTFKGQVIALLIAGLVCTPLIPSATAKSALGGVLALSIADAMGYEKESKGRYGLFTAALVGFAFLCPAFMTGGTNGYTMMGVLPEASLAKVTFIKWFLAMLPWLVVVAVGMYFFIMIFFKPEKSLEGSTLTRESVNQKIKDLGPISKQEIMVGIILGICLIFWIFENTFGISSAIVSIAGAVLCFATGLLKPSEVATAPPWSLIIFLGCALNIGYMMGIAGIDSWLEEVLLPFFSLIQNKYLLVLFIFVAMVLLRFLLISMTASITILMMVMLPVLNSLGIEPFGIGLIIYPAVFIYFTSYQNVTYIPALKAMDDTISHGPNIKSCIAYEVLSLAIFLVCVPYWGMLGVL